jgi:Uma2 family endonuclease
MIAEVLSPGTQRYGRGDKRLAYLSLPTLREYVLIAQDRIQVHDYRRLDGQVNAECLRMADDLLRLDFIDITMPLTQLYE